MLSARLPLWSFGLLLGFSGACLPAYDDNISSLDADMSASGVDMTSPSLDGGKQPESGQFLIGRAIVVDTGQFSDGVFGYVDGYPGNPGPASTATAGLRVPIPTAALGQSHYMFYGGQVPGGLAVVPTVIGPPILLNGQTPTSYIAHVFGKETSNKGLLGAIVRDLGANAQIPAGDAASYEAFIAKWNLYFTIFASRDADGTPHEYNGAVVAVSGDAGTCKVFYPKLVKTFQTAVMANPSTTFLDFASTNAVNHLAVIICPVTQTADVTFSASGNITDPLTGLPVTFNPLTLRAFSGTPMVVDWEP